MSPILCMDAPLSTILRLSIVPPGTSCTLIQRLVGEGDPSLHRLGSSVIIENCNIHFPMIRNWCSSPWNSYRFWYPNLFLFFMFNIWFNRFCLDNLRFQSLFNFFSLFLFLFLFSLFNKTRVLFWWNRSFMVNVTIGGINFWLSLGEIWTILNDVSILTAFKAWSPLNKPRSIITVIANSWMMNFVILRYLVLHHNRLFVVYSCFDCFFSKFYFV